MIKGSPISDLIRATQVNVVSLSVILSGDKVRVLFSVFVLSNVVTVVSLLLLLKLVISVSLSVYHKIFPTVSVLTETSIFTIHDSDNALLMYGGPERTLIPTAGEGTAYI